MKLFFIFKEHSIFFLISTFYFRKKLKEKWDDNFAYKQAYHPKILPTKRTFTYFYGDGFFSYALARIGDYNISRKVLETFRDQLELNPPVIFSTIVTAKQLAGFELIAIGAEEIRVSQANLFGRLPTFRAKRQTRLRRAFKKCALQGNNHLASSASGQNREVRNVNFLALFISDQITYHLRILEDTETEIISIFFSFFQIFAEILRAKLKGGRIYLGFNPPNTTGEFRPNFFDQHILLLSV